MTGYSLMYRFGITPWEGYGAAAAESLAALLDREEQADGVTYVVGDVTELSAAGLGTFDFFLDVGCQGLDGAQRQAAGHGVTDLANHGATMLMLAFGPTRLRSVLGGVSAEDVGSAFPDWEMLAIDPADTAGLGWPLNRTAPRWCRLRRRP
jgi:hypothetical protein